MNQLTRFLRKSARLVRALAAVCIAVHILVAVFT
jgi:hypothetical protein